MTRAELARKFISQVGDKFFAVQFIKKNGELRNMTCRLHVTKGVKGIDTNRAQQDLDNNVLTVYDVNVPKSDGTRGGFRRINLETLRKLTMRGCSIDFENIKK